MLDLANKNIQGGIGSLGECFNLRQLDLSHNRITMLSGIDTLTKMRVCDLSHNKLTTVDAIKPCIGLERLDLQGNMIKDPKALERIGAFLTNLAVLYLQDFDANNQNPVCSNKAYRATILNSFGKNLKAIDG